MYEIIHSVLSLSYQNIAAIGKYLLFVNYWRLHTAPVQDRPVHKQTTRTRYNMFQVYRAFTCTLHVHTSRAHASKPSPNLDHEMLPISISMILWWAVMTAVMSDGIGGPQAVMSEVTPDTRGPVSLPLRLNPPYNNKHLIMIISINIGHWSVCLVHGFRQHVDYGVMMRFRWQSNLHPMITKVGSAINTQVIIKPKVTRGRWTQTFILQHCIVFVQGHPWSQ